jgi:hypothetical protein
MHSWQLKSRGIINLKFGEKLTFLNLTDNDDRPMDVEGGARKNA